MEVCFCEARQQLDAENCCHSFELNFVCLSGSSCSSWWRLSLIELHWTRSEAAWFKLTLWSFQETLLLDASVLGDGDDIGVMTSRSNASTWSQVTHSGADLKSTQASLKEWQWQPERTLSDWGYCWQEVVIAQWSWVCSLICTLWSCGAFNFQKRLLDTSIINRQSKTSF